MGIVVGLLVFFVLAQIMDGRWAWFVGLAVALAAENWRRGSRAIREYLGIAGGGLVGLAAFFLLVGLNGWIALIVGSLVTLFTAGLIGGILGARPGETVVPR